MTPITTQISDAITCSIEREKTTDKEKKKKITLLETFSCRGKKDSECLFIKRKGKKGYFRDLVSKKKKDTLVNPCLAGGKK